MSVLKLGLLCSRPESFCRSAARSALENAVQFFQVSHDEEDSTSPGLSVAQLDASAADLEHSLEEAVENDVTHVLFLSSRTLLPFYSLQRLLALNVEAVSGISWTWLVGRSGLVEGGEPVEIFPRLGFFDPDGRPYPYFGWCAPDLFEVDWCGLDCLLLSREALEEVAEPLRRMPVREPALRVSHCLRSQGIPILIDSAVQCPRAVVEEAVEGAGPLFVPSPGTWREFSRDCTARHIPSGPVYDPAYRGRAWYRDWLKRLPEA